MSPQEICAHIEGSCLFFPDFPRRPRYTHAQWAGLSEKERNSTQGTGVEAIGRVPEYRELAEMVRQLGAIRYQPGVPLLARLWETCALVPVRSAAGAALRSIGSPEARAALAAQIEDSDHLSLDTAVRSFFDQGPGAAFEKLSLYFDPDRVAQPGGKEIPNHALSVLAPSSYPDRGPGGGGWLAAEPRWLKLCVSLRRDPRLGPMARQVLRYADSEVVARFLQEARSHDGPRRSSVRRNAIGDLLTRYRQGQYQAVWQELRACGSIAGDLRQEALEVARETMGRVAFNADLLAQRLASEGWRALTGSLRTLPGPQDREVMREIEQRTGSPLPASLLAFWEVVGGVDLVWDYQDDQEPADLGVDLPMVEMDPLALDPARVTRYQLEEWEEDKKGLDEEIADPFFLSLAPDHYHKANISGGPPYGVELPFGGADPILENEDNLLPLVDYLRLCTQWGGFPRLEAYRDRPDVKCFVNRMTRGMEPF